MSDIEKKHYFLVYGRVMFKDEEGDRIAHTDINCVFMGERKERGVKEIAKVQQMLQIQLFNRLGASVDVVGVTICTFNYLGAMSDEEFNNASPADLGEEVPDQLHLN